MFLFGIDVWLFEPDLFSCESDLISFEMTWPSLSSSFTTTLIVWPDGNSTRVESENTRHLFLARPNENETISRIDSHKTKPHEIQTRSSSREHWQTTSWQLAPRWRDHRHPNGSYELIVPHFDASDTWATMAMEWTHLRSIVMPIEIYSLQETKVI